MEAIGLLVTVEARSARAGFIAKFGFRTDRVKSPCRSRRQIRSRDASIPAT